MPVVELIGMGLRESDDEISSSGLRVDGDWCDFGDPLAGVLQAVDGEAEVVEGPRLRMPSGHHVRIAIAALVLRGRRGDLDSERARVLRRGIKGWKAEAADQGVRERQAAQLFEIVIVDDQSAALAVAFAD